MSQMVVLDVLKKAFPLRRFTVSEYHRMVEAGILYEGERVELIDGVIIKMAQKSKHRIAKRKFAEQFYQIVLERKALLYVQAPITIADDTEPEPDLALVEYREDEYPEGHPTPGDVLLLIEVSDTTLGIDKSIKLPRYAASGIPEVWIVNLVDNRIEVYRDPLTLPDGTATYRIRTDFVKGDVFSPQAFSSLKIAVDEIWV
ncbi:Uma2 family endonuclease [Candidatus Poribacteria bacterium]|nr:Uma2 family endonuclease [Candidatus Poribacteria bacterium]